MSDTPLHLQPLHELAAGLDAGSLTSEAIVRACLDRIEAREPEIKAWAHLDPDYALAQAKARDGEDRRSPMHGIPVAIKDIIDTKDLPAEYGTPIYKGHRPAADAACVQMLKQAGAVILGKTTTTELAALHPTVTANPVNPAHSPGGSSSGSAAAVGDGMAPAALGTQTFGSVIRPAVYCGVIGCKPTFNLIAPAGVKTEAESLDTLGTFTRRVADLPLLLGALTMSPPSVFQAPPPEAPRIAVLRGPAWDKAEPETVHAMDMAAEAFAAAGAAVREVAVEPVLEEALEAHLTVAVYEIVRAFSYEWYTHPEQISEILTGMLKQGEQVALEEYYAARALGRAGRQHLLGILEDTDAIVTPCQPGEAPEGLQATGNPIFNRLWTFVGMPCIALPVTTGPKVLPVGVQLVGRHETEAALIALAQWAEAALATNAAA